MTFREMLRETQGAVLTAIGEIEGRFFDFDEMLAWYQLEKELLFIMLKLLELDAQLGGATEVPPADSSAVGEVNT